MPRNVTLAVALPICTVAAVARFDALGGMTPSGAAGTVGPTPPETVRLPLLDGLHGYSAKAPGKYPVVLLRIHRGRPPPLARHRTEKGLVKATVC